ncbi:hypothetical protein [Fluviicola chungangensis]|uniref:hypothetical protein n=1 Tax=Fluviicola chungangensis TaxID=2597671 RepID=UPI00118494FF|nr:hypothetical protein [Fluviicola chungangensis]
MTASCKNKQTEIEDPIIELRVKLVSDPDPAFILKYKLKTNEYLKKCKMPVIIFHGDKDHGIYPGSSLKLKKEFKAQDTLILLKDVNHNGIIKSDKYQLLIPELLDR